MNSVLLQLENIRKEFSRRVIFDKIDFTLTNGDSLAITGINGSGKSTLVKIIAGILSPTRGSLTLSVNGREMKLEQYHNYIGFVAPYIQMYDEFSAYENLKFFARIRGLRFDKKYIDHLLDRVVLYGRRDDAVRTYSSGMKQRLKYVFALLHKPEILIFDEPRANLDRHGIATAYSIMEEHKPEGILILATNEQEDLPYADTMINLDELRELRIANKQKQDELVAK
jgi:heme exporter protein A